MRSASIVLCVVLGLVGCSRQEKGASVSTQGQRWEYRVAAPPASSERLSQNRDRELTEFLNKAESEGWEYHGSMGMFVVLRKPRS